MTGLDGINSLRTVLSSLSVNDTAAAAATAKAGYIKGAESLATQAGSVGSADRASFSAGALAAQALDTSDVRLTKVAELRQAISNGTYNVPAAAVADKMVEGLLG